MKKTRPFAGMTWSYDYGQFYISPTGDFRVDLDVGSEEAAKRGFISDENDQLIVVLPQGGIGIAGLSFYETKLPRRFYKKRFTANLDLRQGELWLSVVDGGYTFFPIAADRYRFDFGLIRSEGSGPISRNDYDIALTKIGIEQDADRKPDNVGC